MSRRRLALLVLVITGALVVSAAAIARWFDLHSDWVALSVSAASLAISFVTFYLLEIRGPDITIHQIETGARYNKEHSVWIGDGSFEAVIECRLLIANEGRRAGVLQDLKLGTHAFAPHQPRILRAHVHPPRGEDFNEIRTPLVLQDGAILSAVVAIKLTLGDRKNDYQQRCAHDLRELQGVAVPFTYAFASHGSLRCRSGSAWAPLEEFRVAVLENWKDLPAVKVGYRILSEGGEA